MEESLGPDDQIFTTGSLLHLQYNSAATNGGNSMIVCYTRPRSTVGNLSDYRCASNCRSRGWSLITPRSYTFVDIDDEIISTVILFLRLIHSREGWLSVTSESMCTNYWLTLIRDCPGKCLGELTVPPLP